MIFISLPAMLFSANLHGPRWEHSYNTLFPLTFVVKQKKITDNYETSQKRCSSDICLLIRFCK